MFIELKEKIVDDYRVSFTMESSRNDIYFLDIYADGGDRKRYMITLSKGHNDKEELNILLKDIEHITPLVVERLYSLQDVKGFSSGRLIRYIEAGRSMNRWFKVFSLSFVVFVLILGLDFYLFHLQHALWLTIAECFVAIISYILYRKYSLSVRKDDVPNA